MQPTGETPRFFRQFAELGVDSDKIALSVPPTNGNAYLSAAADSLRARIGAQVEQLIQKENENALTRLRAQLGDVVFELAWSKGATITTEQAIALALS